jgi:hypothetical protein
MGLGLCSRLILMLLARPNVPFCAADYRRLRAQSLTRLPGQGTVYFRGHMGIGSEEAGGSTVPLLWRLCGNGSREIERSQRSRRPLFEDTVQKI